MQTTTDENFRTPMRETRYAVMALAEAFPRPGAPGQGWRNRDDAPAHLPRTDTLVHILDDLENLWDVPEAETVAFERAIVPLLDYPEPVVRATSAACLGRVGESGPSSHWWPDSAIRPRSSGGPRPGRCDAWAIKGSAGTRSARAPRARTRRHAEAPHESLPTSSTGWMTDTTSRSSSSLTRDPDLWTRLQAIRTLRQWFYRTNDSNFAASDRRNLPRPHGSRGFTGHSQESQRGTLHHARREPRGRSQPPEEYQRLPEGMRAGILDARRTFRTRRAPDTRSRRIEARDQPPAICDPGSLRRFVLQGPLLRPSTNRHDRRRQRPRVRIPLRAALLELEHTFMPLLSADLPPESRMQAIRLASFFRLPSLSQSLAIQKAILRRLADPDERVAGAARKVVADELDLARADLERN